MCYTANGGALGSCLSDVFPMSNGVQQGSVLPPVLFAVYLLAGSGVGCFGGSLFASEFYYANDIVLLAPCASALRIICMSYVVSHGLQFNAQLICFRIPSIQPCNYSYSYHIIICIMFHCNIPIM